jgi:hypothetical protein
LRHDPGIIATTIRSLMDLDPRSDRALAQTRTDGEVRVFVDGRLTDDAASAGFGSPSEIEGGTSAVRAL